MQMNVSILRYFSVQPGGGVQAGEAKRPEQAPLQLVWQDNGTVAMKADNGKFVGAKKSGHLFANVDVLEDNSRFFFYLTNRPIMILKCEQGYVGYRMATSVKLDCNKASYATFQVERADGGLVHFKGKFQRLIPQNLPLNATAPRSEWEVLAGERWRDCLRQREACTRLLPRAEGADEGLHQD